MGMKDERLTPGEHDELRARLLTGAKRIRPAGAHRRAIVTTSVAVVIVAGVSVGALGFASFLRTGDEVAPIATSGPSPAPSATAFPTPTSSPTPTTTPVAIPTVAFDGECDRVLTDEVAAQILGSLAPPRVPTAFSLNSDTRASAALLGGVICGWNSADGSEYLGVSVYPVASVAASVREAYGSSGCRTAGACEIGRQIGDFWVGAGVSYDTATAEPSEAEMAEAVARAEAVIDQVAPALSTTSGVAEPRGADWWTLGDCASLEGAVQSSARTTLVPGFPGDSVPSGLDWDVLVGAGLDQWCSWYSESSELVEVMVQPGVGAPSAEQVGAASTVDVAGADATWYTEDSAQPGDYTFVSVVGVNRVLVRYMTGVPDVGVGKAAEMVAAVLGQLG